MQVGVSAIILAGILLVPQSSSNEAWVKVRRVEGQNVQVEAIVPARFGFRIEEGLSPSSGLLRCKQRNEQRTVGNVTYPVVVLECEGGLKMVMVEVDLTQ